MKIAVVIAPEAAPRRCAGATFSAAVMKFGITSPSPIPSTALAAISPATPPAAAIAENPAATIR